MDSDPQTQALATTSANSLAIVDPANAFGRPIVVPALFADVGSPSIRRTRCAGRSMPSSAAAAQARELLDSNDPSTVVGLRDRALIVLMTFQFRPRRRGGGRHARRGLFRRRQALAAAPQRKRRQRS